MNHLTPIFKKYIGSIIQDPSRLSSDYDPLAGELNKIAQSNGLTLRFIKAGQGMTADFNQNRLNVHIRKNKKGEWRINHFNLG